MDELPGPSRWPLLGNLPQMRPSLLHHQFDEWCDEYGPLYQLRMPGRRIVVVSDPDLNREILRDRPGGFRRQSAIESVMDEMGSNGLFSLEGDAWRLRRRLAMPAFNAAHLRSFHPTLETITGRLRRRWEQHSPKDIRGDLTRYTVDVTAKLTFDYDINTIEQSGDIIQRHLELIFPLINRRINSPVPYWRYVKLPGDRALERALAALRTDLAAVIGRARANSPQQPTNFIEAFLLAQDDSASFTDDELFAEALTILIAGQDTTSNAMAWLLYHLAGNPAVQERIRDEVTEIPSALGRQPYLEAVVVESMRLRPTTPIVGLEAVKYYIRAAKQHMGEMAPNEVIGYGLAVTLPWILGLSFGRTNTAASHPMGISNVPGPRNPLYWNGARLETIYPISLLMHGNPLNFTCIGYQGGLHFGVLGVQDKLPPMAYLTAAMDVAVDELADLLLPDEVRTPLAAG
ncbi:cytochrome P450 [Nocardia sp. NBC_00565]|uniref:cytochrome P450 n=1 Tax=Nocardia sp. NBC_00565 TaxID=2975993 RepID=UPI002E803749|nr:cytochrome P450 [Nocardia sp. NBC_00565]WUC08291.1 cytochrome P450 [Nocardia sp. NBC_00565]